MKYEEFKEDIEAFLKNEFFPFTTEEDLKKKISLNGYTVVEEKKEKGVTFLKTFKPKTFAKFLFFAFNKGEMTVVVDASAEKDSVSLYYYSDIELLEFDNILKCLEERNLEGIGNTVKHNPISYNSSYNSKTTDTIYKYGTLFFLDNGMGTNYYIKANRSKYFYASIGKYLLNKHSNLKNYSLLNNKQKETMAMRIVYDMFIRGYFFPISAYINENDEKLWEVELDSVIGNLPSFLIFDKFIMNRFVYLELNQRVLFNEEQMIEFFETFIKPNLMERLISVVNDCLVNKSKISRQKNIRDIFKTEGRNLNKTLFEIKCILSELKDFKLTYNFDEFAETFNAKDSNSGFGGFREHTDALKSYLTEFRKILVFKSDNSYEIKDKKEPEKIVNLESIFTDDYSEEDEEIPF